MEEGSDFMMGNGVYCRYYEVLAGAYMEAYLKKIKPENVKEILRELEDRKLKSVSREEAGKIKIKCYPSILNRKSFYIECQYR